MQNLRAAPEGTTGRHHHDTVTAGLGRRASTVPDGLHDGQVLRTARLDTLVDRVVPLLPDLALHPLVIHAVSSVPSRRYERIQSYERKQSGVTD